MKEISLRKWHRRIGGTSVFFILFQAISGFLLTIPRFTALNSALVYIHHGYGPLMIIYRVILGISLTVLAFLGIAILLKIRARSKKGVSIPEVSGK